ncbi:MAG: recombinase family protein [Cetobacterium sp.]
MIYGYCRISMKSQNIERQIRNILAFNPEAKLYQESFTGTKTEGRKEFQKLVKKVLIGDTIIFDSVSRMSRSAEEGVQLYFELLDKGVNLIFLKEPYINTEIYKKAISRKIDSTGHKIADLYIEATNEAIKILAENQIIIAFNQAEKEVMDLRERTKEGLKTAKLNGKKLGRVEGRTVETSKSKSAKEIIQKHYKIFGGTLSSDEVIYLSGISRNTFFKYVRELK